jgi:hypothetical protein
MIAGMYRLRRRKARIIGDGLASVVLAPMSFMPLFFCFFYAACICFAFLKPLYVQKHTLNGTSAFNSYSTILLKKAEPPSQLTGDYNSVSTAAVNRLGFSTRESSKPSIQHKTDTS